MNKLLKFILFGLLILLVLVKADETSQEDKEEIENDQEDKEESSEENKEESNEEEDDKIDVNVDAVTVYIFSNGKKIAYGTLNVKGMEESIENIQAIGTDLDQYEVAHRGIIFDDMTILYEEADKIVSVDPNDSDFYTISYQYLPNEWDKVDDPFLGFALQGKFSKGDSADAYSTELSFTFGHCDDDFNSSSLDQVKALFEVLIAAHKDMIKDKQGAAKDSCASYTTYSALYDEAVTKRDFAEEIPTLESKLDNKNNECDQKQRDYDSAKADLDNEQAIVNANKQKINVLSNEITQLNSEKSALDKEQIDRNNKNITHEARIANANSYKNTVKNAIKQILAVDPNFFDGRTCFNESTGAFDSFCINRLNAI